MQACIADMLRECVSIRGSLDQGLEITTGKLLCRNFMFLTMKFEMSYNLVAGNDIESTYEMMFAVLSMQVVWDL